MNTHTFLPNENDYQNTISVQTTDQKTFESLTLQIDKWWTDELEGSAKQINDVFKVSFGSTFMEWVIEEIIPNRKIVWKCIDANTDVPELSDKKEWIGTTVTWDISSQNGVTNISIRHIGLTPDFECYDICERGWDTYFAGSLSKFLNTGEGIPYTAADSEKENTDSLNSVHK